MCEPVAMGYVRLEVQKSLFPVCVCEPVAMGYVRLEVQKSLLPVVCVCEGSEIITSCCGCVNQLLWDMLGWRFRNHYFLLWVCEPVAMGYVRLEVQKSLLPVVGV